MTSEAPKTADPIIKKFAEEAEKFSVRYPEEGGQLQGELTLWGLAVFESGLSQARITGELIKEQIVLIAENWSNKSGKVITPEEVIEDLFSLNPEGKIDADIIMGRFQLWP